MTASKQPSQSKSHGRSRAYALASALMALLPAMAQAQGDAETGKQLYQHYCLGCHGDERTGAAVGPNLKGVWGRKAASDSKGIHSQALVDAKITWNQTTLRKFLAAPVKELPGTYMPTGVPDRGQIDHIIAFLRTLH